MVADGTALLMAAIASAGAEAAVPLREAALAEGAVLTHLHRAIFAAGQTGCGARVERHHQLHALVSLVSMHLSTAKAQGKGFVETQGLL